MENEFSKIEHSVKQFEQDVADRAELRPAEPFPKSEMTESKRLARVIRAEKSYWEFDRLYFPEEMYSDGYSKPGKYHKELLRHAGIPGLHFELGPRKHGKTVEFKKILPWLLITGRMNFTGTMSSTMPMSSRILKSVSKLIGENPRIVNDFRPEFIENNSERFAFRIPKQKGLRVCEAFSEGVSVRGASEIFDRPRFILCDDIETRLSALGEMQVEERIRFISESYASMTSDGIMVVLGNNFSEKGALNRIKKLKEENLLPENWYCHAYKAWDGKRSLWPERYPARSEEELKKMLLPYDESEWQGDYQQNPIPPEGMIFQRKHYHEWELLPERLLGVMFCDPNLSKKGKGDTTAVMSLCYCPEDDRYYVPEALCRSYSDSDVLLTDVLSMKQRLSGVIIILGFDGNVNQESTWTNNVRNWCRLHGSAYPVIDYKHYHVDMLAKNAQKIYNEDKILFPKGFSQTTEGQRFIEQLFAFTSKKANNPDDGPDCLISSVELLTESGFVRQPSTLREPLIKSF